MYYNNRDVACHIGGLTPKPKANADVSAEWRVGSVIPIAVADVSAEWRVGSEIISH